MVFWLLFGQTFTINGECEAEREQRILCGKRNPIQSNQNGILWYIRSEQKFTRNFIFIDNFVGIDKWVTRVGILIMCYLFQLSRNDNLIRRIHFLFSSLFVLSYKPISCNCYFIFNYWCPTCWYQFRIYIRFLNSEKMKL